VAPHGSSLVGTARQSGDCHLLTDQGEQDRTYYRVCCRGPADEQMFDLSHDAVMNRWVLDVAHD
jgi:hypothetical protein